MELVRYLVPFDTRRLPRLEADVVVLGSGIAGLRLALEAARERTVLLVTKDHLAHSASDAAQGGIAAVIGENDSCESHVADTLGAGDGLCDRPVVEEMVRAAPGAVGELLEWGTAFDRAGGRPALTREGGHSRARILHARGDSTGAEIVATLIARVEATPRIRILEHCFAIDLVTDPAGGGACRGVLVFTRHGEFQFLDAPVIVLATGGAGQLYRETTNPAVATGDGQAMAFRAGAELEDLEFVQFHPTTLYIAGAPRTLISEAVRGEGAQLVNAAGERFMPAVHPSAELAPRDVVSRAIVREMKRSGETCVYLDLRHLDSGAVRSRFPRIAGLCDTFSLDLARETIPVRPAAHYMVGGVRADLDGRTGVPGLLACGEAACTGFHGANRLGSNSLLEGLVLGARVGREAARLAGESRPGGTRFEAGWSFPDAGGLTGAIDMEDLERSLKSLMWRQAGIEREARELAAAARQLEFWGRYIWRRTFFRPAGWSLQNMMALGWVIVRAALAREESRGVHWRADFPRRSERAWHSRVRPEAAEVGRRPVVEGGGRNP